MQKSAATNLVQLADGSHVSLRIATLMVDGLRWLKANRPLAFESLTQIAGSDEACLPLAYIPDLVSHVEFLFERTGSGRDIPVPARELLRNFLSSEGVITDPRL